MSQDLHLRTLEKDDLKFLHKLNNDPNVMDYWFSEPYMSMEQLQDLYEKSQENKKVRQFILTNNEERLGLVALYSIEQRHRNAEFAIMIDPEQQGNGYASPATQLAVDYAFLKLNLHKVYLHAITINEKAIHIYKKIGFQVESELKEHFFVNGEYHDAVMMSIFQRDYWKLQSK
ncbi:GNAT family N-acetyltransferase [Virgibacillus doumboii]|uniref:GNAT family N-acetyltransferase n=1 Tax=Virgibacillus doumboii TaxID=2697503 RepID=UPI0013DF8EF8|nr:GNAT family N-acetyltransferase [Virgibacillus doumboii]